MAQAQAGADFGIAGAIAGATAGKAGAAAGSISSAAVSKAAGDLTRALNAVQTGFVDAATAAGVKATKAIAATETVERKAVAKADVVLAQDLQSAWGTYAAAERSAVTLNARERATIGADYKKEVAGAELAAVKAVAPARKTSMVATAEANGVYHVKVTGIIADLGILGGEIKVEATKAKALSISAWLGKKAQGLWDTAKDVVGTISKSYDTISLAAHTALGAGGMIPGYGIFPDAADLALTLVELPFGKSDGKDLALATVSLVTTAAPGPVDVAAGGMKITTRMAKAGARVADAAKGASSPLRAVDPKTAANALDFFRRDTYLFGGVIVTLDKSSIKHILERHHPRFWDGSLKKSQTFFPRNMSIDEIRSTIGDVLAQNRDQIAAIGPNGTGQIRGCVNGIWYTLGLQRGRVGQFFPIGPQ